MVLHVIQQREDRRSCGSAWETVASYALRSRKPSIAETSCAGGYGTPLGTKFVLAEIGAGTRGEPDPGGRLGAAPASTYEGSLGLAAGCAGWTAGYTLPETDLAIVDSSLARVAWSNG
jgi:hypothetical protein